MMMMIMMTVVVMVVVVVFLLGDGGIGGLEMGRNDYSWQASSP